MTSLKPYTAICQYPCGPLSMRQAQPLRVALSLPRSPQRSRSLSPCRSAAPGSDVQRSAAQVDTEHAPDLGHRVTGEAPIRGCRGEGYEQAGVIGMADPAEIGRAHV